MRLRLTYGAKESRLSLGRGRETWLGGVAPALLFALGIVGLYWLQTLRPDDDALVVALGLAPYDVGQGRVVGVFTYMLLHGSWLHAGANAVFAFLAGYWVARRLGHWSIGLVNLILFYVVSGAVSGLAYVWLHPGSQTLLIGASGAVSALIGGATRLAFAHGVMRPVLSRTVVSVSAAWVLINFVIAAGAADPESGAMPVAWEAHLAGFFVGLVLIGPWAMLFGPRPAAAEAAPNSPYAEMEDAAAPPADGATDDEEDDMRPSTRGRAAVVEPERPRPI